MWFFGRFFCFLRPAFGHGCLGHPQSLEYLQSQDNFYEPRKMLISSNLINLTLIRLRTVGQLNYFINHFVLPTFTKMPNIKQSNKLKQLIENLINKFHVCYFAVFKVWLKVKFSVRFIEKQVWPLQSDNDNQTMAWLQLWIRGP